MVMPSSREMQIGPVGSDFPSGVLQSVELLSGGLQASFADRTVTFNLDWLRDNCPCNTCRILQTDERRWQPWLDVQRATVASHTLAGDGLHIVWSTGHHSTFTDVTWKRIALASRRGGYTMHLWTSRYDVSRFGHDQVIGDMVTRRQFLEAFRRDGVVIVNNSPTTPGSCINFLGAVGITLRDSSLGLIFDVKLDPAGYNVAFTAEALPPHNDNAQYTNPPSGQVLAMLVNDATGGHNIIVDGFSIVDQLPPAAVAVLSRVAVGFRQYSPQAEGFTRQPLIELDREGRCTHLRFSNQLMQPLPFDDPDLAAWYDAYRLLGTAISDPENHVTFRLDAGDTLIVNNHRVLHAREAFVPDGPRHLQDIYFDADDVIGLLAQMTGEAKNEMVQESRVV
jgi:gamma-butyrobetaine dioxygenase